MKKSLVRHGFVFLPLLVSPSLGVAQTPTSAVSVTPSGAESKPLIRVTGQVIEKSSEQSLPYATISVKEGAEKVIKRLATDDFGKFEVELPIETDLTVIVTSVGFKPYEKTFRIGNTDKKTYALGKLKVQEGVELKEVTVSTFKPLVKNDPDKITYNMEADPEAQSNNVLEMLRKVPLLTVDSDENIRLNGQSNFKVLMNGKSSSMLNGSLKEVLKSIPANTIKDIEVITNPSSKYEAEGVGGIINIITTKNKLNGVFGSVGANVDEFGGFGGNLFLSSKIDKFSFSGRYFGNRYKRPSNTSESYKENFVSEEYRYMESASSSRYDGQSHGLSVESSYEIDSLNLLTLSFWGHLRDSKSKSSAHTEEFDIEKELSRSYTNDYISKSNGGSVSGNLDYQRTFKKPDKSFTVSYKIDCNPSGSNSENNITTLLNYYDYRQKSKNDAMGQEHTIQMDYYDPLTKNHQVEGGVKYILRKNTSDSDIYLWEENQWVYQENRVNDLDYTQHILGLYGGYVYKMKKFSTKAGLRLESTWNDGVFTSTTETRFDNNLFNVVPYVTLSYKLKPTQTVKVSYTQRLSRPGIWYLNPYVNDVDPFNIRYGNPNLVSEISHAFNAGYSYFSPKYNVNAGLTYNLLNNGIESVSTINSEGVTTSTYENIGHRQSVGLNLYGSAQFSKKLSLYTNMNGSYVDISAGEDSKLKNSGFSLNGYMGLRWVAWENGSINLNGGLYSPSVLLQGKSALFYYTSMGISHQMLKKKLSLSLSVSDPFWKYKTGSTTLEDESFYSKSTYRNRARSIRFSVSYRFGKMNIQVKKAKRGINNDDVKSGGSSNSGE